MITTTKLLSDLELIYDKKKANEIAVEMILNQVKNNIVPINSFYDTKNIETKITTRIFILNINL
jgi:hypothetical protein